MHPVEVLARPESVDTERSNALKVFEFAHSQVRVIDRDGEPWFVAKDVAEILGYLRPENAVAVHCRVKEKVNLGYSSNQGGTPVVTIIPERDVYRLVMRSKLPGAEKFEEWVVGDVLPSIRKTGRYSVEHIGRKQLAQMVIQAETEREQLAAQVVELAPKAEGYDQMMAGRNALSMAQAAKVLGTGQRRLFAHLRNCRVLMKNNLPYQAYLDRGYFRVVLKPIITNHGQINHKQTLVTPKGMDFLRTLGQPERA